MLFLRYVVTIAVLINVPTATNERVEKRDNPQIPWPLVHPFANRVPNPTNNPPITNPAVEVVNEVELEDKKYLEITPEPIIPNI